MNAGVIILARMSSNRLPGKVLMDLAGKPLLARVMARARRIRVADRLVVATSRDASDDPIARFCRAAGQPVFRGRDRDVAGRMLECALSYGWDLMARVNADSPLLQPELIEAGMIRAMEENLQFVTNIHPRSYPYGVAVEVFRTDALATAHKQMSDPEDFEHVTAYFYRHATQLRMVNLSRPGAACTDVRLTVDDEEDLRRASAVIELLGDRFEKATLDETIAAYRAACRAPQAGCLVRS